MKDITLKEIKEIAKVAQHLIYNNGKLLIYPNGEEGICMRIANFPEELFGEIKNIQLENYVGVKKEDKNPKKSGKRKHRFWTEQEIELVLEMYPVTELRKKLFKALSEKFDRSEGEVRNKIFMLKEKGRL